MIGHPPRAFAIVVRTLLIVAYAIPLLWIVLTAFKSNPDILTAPNSFVFRPSLQAFHAVFASGAASVLTSLKVAVLTTVAVLVIATPASFALARRTSALWGHSIAVVLGSLLILQMVPQPMTVIPLYGVLAKWRLINSLTGLIIADVALFVPFAILMLRPFVLGIPGALYEAGELDGASRLQAFRYVVVPLLSNGIATVATVVFIAAWGEFIYAINFLSAGSTLPVAGQLAQQISQYSVSWNTMMALAFITALPLILVFVLSQKRLINGLTVGAVK